MDVQLHDNNFTLWQCNFMAIISRNGNAIILYGKSCVPESDCSGTHVLGSQSECSLHIPQLPQQLRPNFHPVPNRSRYLTMPTLNSNAINFILRLVSRSFNPLQLECLIRTRVVGIYYFTLYCSTIASNPVFMKKLGKTVSIRKMLY